MTMWRGFARPPWPILTPSVAPLSFVISANISCRLASWLFAFLVGFKLETAKILRPPAGRRPRMSQIAVALWGRHFDGKKSPVGPHYSSRTWTLLPSR